MILLTILLIVLIIYLATTSDKRAKARKMRAGKEGEEAVAEEIRRIAPQNARVFHDLVLFDKNKKTYQIDHLFINTNGIWIIETKNWSGVVLGDEENKYWTQYKKYKTERRYNPVKQNFGHYYKIRSLFPKHVPIRCLVVFVKADISNIQSEYICNLFELPEILLRETDNKLTDFEIQKYYQKVLSEKEKCGVSTEEHERTIENKKTGLSQGICPNCGGKLVERKGPSGAFYGCTNFPKCTFTIDKIADCA